MKKILVFTICSLLTASPLIHATNYAYKQQFGRQHKHGRWQGKEQPKITRKQFYSQPGLIQKKQGSHQVSSSKKHTQKKLHLSPRPSLSFATNPFLFSLVWFLILTHIAYAKKQNPSFEADETEAGTTLPPIVRSAVKGQIADMRQFNLPCGKLGDGSPCCCDLNNEETYAVKCYTGHTDASAENSFVPEFSIEFGPGGISGDLSSEKQLNTTQIFFEEDEKCFEPYQTAEKSEKLLNNKLDVPAYKTTTTWSKTDTGEQANCSIKLFKISKSAVTTALGLDTMWRSLVKKTYLSEKPALFIVNDTICHPETLVDPVWPDTRGVILSFDSLRMFSDKELASIMATALALIKQQDGSVDWNDKKAVAAISSLFATGTSCMASAWAKALQIPPDALPKLVKDYTGSTIKNHEKLVSLILALHVQYKKALELLLQAKREANTKFASSGE